MNLSACVGCTLPVLELEGQFDKLDAFFIEDRVPSPATAGWWHVSCLRGSSAGPAWHAARLRNYRDVRQFEQVAALPGWTVIRDPRRGKTLAIGHSGELVELSIGGRGDAREVEGGLVFPRIEDEFHLGLDEASILADIKDALTATTVYPLAAVLAAMGLAERIVHPEALEGAQLRFDNGLERLWTMHSVSARLEYGVFLPRELAPYVGELIR